MSLEHPHRLTGLDKQSLVRIERLQPSQDFIKTLPVARCPPDTSVNHETCGVFRDFRIQIILDHSEGRLRQPTLAGQARSSRSANPPCGISAARFNSRAFEHGFYRGILAFA